MVGRARHQGPVREAKLWAGWRWEGKWQGRPGTEGAAPAVDWEARKHCLGAMLLDG